MIDPVVMSLVKVGHLFYLAKSYKTETADTGWHKADWQFSDSLIEDRVR